MTEPGAPGAIVQLRKLRGVSALREHLATLQCAIPISDTVDPAGVLASPIEVDGRRIGNRFAALPMEGWDAETDGRPSDLVERRWRRLGESGAKLVWGEASAVRSDGRANPNQLLLAAEHVDQFAALRGGLESEHARRHDTVDDLVVGLQLTHSGRWSRPTGAPAPRVAYRHPVLDRRVPVEDASVLSDDELDDLAAAFVAAAARAADAGFDFVDVKHCHGYLLHELLSAYDRPGRFGGDFDGRTRFLRLVVEGIRETRPELAVAVRVSIFDVAPFTAGPDGRGTVESGGTDPYRYAFGGDGTGVGIDLDEADTFLALCAELGVRLVSCTAGSPYYCPHVQRPAYFPPSDGYQPPHDPLLDVARMLDATATLKRRHPELVVVGSGYSYLQELLPNVADAVVGTGGSDLVGLGRMMLSYPMMPADVLAGAPIDRRHVCRTFSDCTTAPRNGVVSGCYPLDEYYKVRPERAVVTAAKRAASAGRGGRRRGGGSRSSSGARQR